MQAGATWLGSNMTLTSSALVVFGARRAMTASSLPLRWDVVRLHHPERCAQKPGPIAGSKLFTRDARRELYDIFCNIVGSIVSPLLANLFVHDPFDGWMPRNHPDIPFERYAADAVCHGQTEAQAQRLRQELEQRFAECRRELHPQKTKLVSGKDEDRRGTYPNERFDVLGDTCRARRSKHRWGQYCVNVSPAASAEATRDVRRELRGWHLHTRRDTSLEDLSRMFNPVLRGWVTSDSRFDQSALSPTFQHVDRILVRGALRKYTRLRGHQRRAAHWLRRIARRQPDLFAHWRLWQAAAGL
jgi:hypothetical protein